jgi:hypothetical protein
LEQKLKIINDQRGDLCHVSCGDEVPFEIKRVYMLSNVPHDVVRGKHAHKKLNQFIFAAAGCFILELYDGYNIKIHKVSKLSNGVHIGPRVWRTLHSFTPDAVCVVLASELYDEADYIRSKEEFHEFVRGKN